MVTYGWITLYGGACLRYTGYALDIKMFWWPWSIGNVNNVTLKMNVANLLDMKGSASNGPIQFAAMFICCGWLILWICALVLYWRQSLMSASTYSSAIDIRIAQKKLRSTFDCLTAHSSGTWLIKFYNLIAWGQIFYTDSSFHIGIFNVRTELFIKCCFWFDSIWCKKNNGQDFSLGR